MRLIKSHTQINFLGQRYIAYAISTILVVISLVSLATQGLALGIDFTGGVTVQVKYPEPANVSQIRDTLAQTGYPDATVQLFGSPKDIIIRLGPQEGKETAKVSGQIMDALTSKASGVELSRVQFVGAQVGDELLNKGGLALLYTMIGILIYVIVRFHWKLATGAVVALAHNVFIVVGMFSLFQWEFDLTIVAALLAILGYGVNDTIVNFDRVRENFPRMRKADAFTVINASVNQMLSRTIITSLTVWLAILSLLLLGGSSIHGFSLAMLIGTVFGTYASVYVAGAISLELNVSREDLFPPKEDENDTSARSER